MGPISWIIIGLLAAWIAGLVTGHPREGCLTKIAVGVLGAFIGGALAQASGHQGVTGLNLRSIVVAGLGASLLLFILGALEGRRH